MSQTSKAGRVTIPVLLVMLALLLVGAYFVYVGAESEEMQGPEGAQIGALEEATLEVDGGWRRHDWTQAEPSAPPVQIPVDGPSPGDPEDQDAVWDPQRRTSESSFPDSPSDAGVRAPFAPTELSARIVTLSGERAIDRTAGCDVRVLPVRARDFGCLVRVMCGGEVLYPNQAQTAGYLPCDVEAGLVVRGRDDGSTAEDTDPRIQFDLRAGTVIVSDEGAGVQAFSATLRITN